MWKTLFVALLLCFCGRANFLEKLVDALEIELAREEPLQETFAPLENVCPTGYKIKNGIGIGSQLIKSASQALTYCKKYTCLAISDTTNAGWKSVYGADAVAVYASSIKVEMQGHVYFMQAPRGVEANSDWKSCVRTGEVGDPADRNPDYYQPEMLEERAETKLSQSLPEISISYPATLADGEGWNQELELSREEPLQEYKPFSFTEFGNCNKRVATIGAPGSLREAKIMFLNNADCAHDGITLQYSKYSQRWGAFCCAHDASADTNKNWKQYKFNANTDLKIHEIVRKVAGEGWNQELELSREETLQEYKRTQCFRHSSCGPDAYCADIGLLYAGKVAGFGQCHSDKYECCFNSNALNGEACNVPCPREGWNQELELSREEPLQEYKHYVQPRH